MKLILFLASESVGRFFAVIIMLKYKHQFKSQSLHRYLAIRETQLSVVIIQSTDSCFDKFKLSVVKRKHKIHFS